MPHSIRTERLVLQPISRRQAPALWRQIRDYAVLRNTSLWPYPLSYAHTLFMLDQLEPGSTTDPVFAVIKNGEVAGTIGLHQRKDDTYTIGYMLGTRFWGSGVASEAVRAICKFGFKQLSVGRILAEVYTDNPGSDRVLVKNGFVQRPGTTMGYSTARGQAFPITTWDLTRERLRP